MDNPSKDQSIKLKPWKGGGLRLWGPHRQVSSNKKVDMKFVQIGICESYIEAYQEMVVQVHIELMEKVYIPTVLLNKEEAARYLRIRYGHE